MAWPTAWSTRPSPRSRLLLLLRPAAPLNDADWKVNFAVLAYEGIKFGPVSFDYHGPGDMTGSGCGNDNAKCSCSDFPVGEGYTMVGVGSSDTWTGLTFGCLFTVDGNACALYVDVPFSADNKITWSCPGYDLIGGQLPPGGHDFTQKMMVMKSA